MIFKWGDYTLDPEITNEQLKESKHTGNQLKILNISFESYQEIEKPELLYSEDKQWKIVNSSYSYMSGNSIKTYNWTIEELEELKISKLIIDNMEFEPYLYNEEIEEGSGDALIITAVIEITGEMWQKINEIPDDSYFPIIRQGISKEEREMRFGRFLWSENGDKIKCRVVLVEKIYDNYNNRLLAFSQPESSVIKFQILKTSKKVDNLLSLLSDKGIITNEEKERVMTVNEEELDFNIFDEVKDLEKFLEDTGQLEELKKVE